MSCKEKCKELDQACPNEECRYHIEFEEDLNCSLISIEKKGAMTLGDIAERLNLSAPRIKQIEDKVKTTLKKRIISHDLLSLLE